MDNRIVEQYLGFINTKPLWEYSEPFELEQFKLPDFTDIIPQENEILKEAPSLSHKFVLGKRVEGFLVI